MQGLKWLPLQKMQGLKKVKKNHILASERTHLNYFTLAAFSGFFFFSKVFY